MLILLLVLLLLVLIISPKRFDGFSDAIALDGEVEKTEDAESGDDVQQRIARRLVRAWHVIFHYVMHTVVGVEWHGEGKDQINGHVEDGGREKQSYRQRRCHDPR